MEKQLVIRVLQGKPLLDAIKGTGTDVITAKKIIKDVCWEAAPEIAGLFDWKELQFAKTIRGLRGYASYLTNAINVMENK